MISYQTASSPSHLKAILDLQQANLPKNISKQEAKEQGFVTVEHDLAILSEMNEEYGHQIAIEEDQLAGYALVMLPKFSQRVAVLVPLFERLNQLNWKGTKLTNIPYFVIGQLCVSKEYRGRGVSKNLYDSMAHTLAPHFKLMITEVSINNIASINAHIKAGFEDILHYKDTNNLEWVVVARSINKE